MTSMTMRVAAVGMVTALTAWAQSSSAPDRLPPPIAPGTFERLHQTLVPSPEDLAQFWDLPWQISIHEARTIAAAQDKPILAYFGANGSVLGAT